MFIPADLTRNQDTVRVTKQTPICCLFHVTVTFDTTGFPEYKEPPCVSQDHALVMVMHLRRVKYHDLILA